MKIYILIITLFILISCGKFIDEQYKHPIYKNNTLLFMDFEITTITYNNHDYIICRRASYDSGISIIHSPDCKCFKTLDKK
jgi:hypothetical protein